MAVDAPVTTKVEQASRKDLPQLKDALARAFYEDPVLGWLIPDERKRPRRLRKFFELELGHIGFARGIVWTTAERTGSSTSVLASGPSANCGSGHRRRCG
jgi:hypothetical protein